MPATVADVLRRIKAGVLEPSDRATGPALPLDVSQLFDRLRRALVPKTALEIFDEWFPWARDQRLAADPSVPDEERMAAIDRIVADIPWGPNSDWSDRERGAWRELRVRAEAEQRPIKELKRDLLAEAVVLVLADRDRFRRIRVGSGAGSFYLREDETSPLLVRPIDLPYSANPEVADGAPDRFAESPYRYWFRREVQKAAMAILLDEPYPLTDAASEDAGEQERAPLEDDSLLPADATADPLVALLQVEAQRATHARLASALAQATPRQQQLLSLIAAGASAAEAARALGIAESTARVQLKRLREKVM